MRYVIMVCMVFLFLGCSSKPADGKSLFQDDCASCHGKHARKSAFGKSQVIANWPKENIKSAIIGYQNKTYGGSMRNMMRQQVKSLDESEIDAIAEYITSLND